MQKQIRQGDVLLVPCEAKPTGKKVKPVKGRTILAYGEVTGHNHSLDSRVAALFGGDRDGAGAVRVRRGAAGEHAVRVLDVAEGGDVS